MEVKEQILNGARELYMRYGLKSITMDDVARHLSISKKTIYQFYEDKDALVLEVVNKEMSEQKCSIEEISDNSKDVIEEMMKTSDFLRSRVSKINPSLMFDLKKYHPKAWQIFQQHKKQIVIKHLKESFIRGIEQGYFRKGINIDILAYMRLEQVDMAFNPDVFPPEMFNLTEVTMSLFEHFVYGISTIKGHQRLNELKHIKE